MKNRDIAGKKILKYVLIIMMLYGGVTYSQLDDILKDGIPDIKSWTPGGAITTTFDDAYAVVPWLNDFDIESPSRFDWNKSEPGYYYSWVESFCLKAGKRGPVSGSGYLLAPLKGDMAKIIKNILNRSRDHKEISREDIQVLLWAIESGTNFRDCAPDFQQRVAPLLTPEEILKLNFKTSDIFDLLPGEIKDAANYYQNMRQLILNPQTAYKDIEALAVPIDVTTLLGVDSIYNGAWGYIGNGYYARGFSNWYMKTYYELYKPFETGYIRDSRNRITSIKSGAYEVKILYRENEEIVDGKFPVSVFSKVQVVESGTVVHEIENSGWVISPGYKHTSIYYAGTDITNQLTADECKRRVKLAGGILDESRDYLTKIKPKKKTKLKESELLEVSEITEALRVLFDSDAKLSDDTYNKVLDGLNNGLYYINSVYCGQAGDKSGQSLSSPNDELAGSVFVPANTDRQRLGTGGRETEPDGNPPVVQNPGGRKRDRRTGGPNWPVAIDSNVNVGNDPDSTNDDNPEFVLVQVNRDQLPREGDIFETHVENRGAEVRVLKIDYKLFEITSECGAFVNDKSGANLRELDYNLPANLNSFLQETQRNGNFIQATDNNGGSLNRQIQIECLDFGGGAKLQAWITYTNKDGVNVTEEVKAENTGLPYIPIPYDMNFNRIADKWEEMNRVVDAAVSLDDERSPGNTYNGDGMTLYEEYRGMQVVEYGTHELVHKRMDPNSKEIFIVDDGGVFENASIAWEKASGTKVYLLDGARHIRGSNGGTESDDEYRRVNICSDYSQGEKFALIVKIPAGLQDPYSIENDHDILGYTDNCISYSPKVNLWGTPKTTKRVLVFPARIMLNLDSTRIIFEQVLLQYPHENTFNYGRRTYSRDFMQKMVRRLENNNFTNQILNYLTMRVLLHEIAHACWVHHHGNEQPRSGVNTCPMYYREAIDEYPEFLDIIGDDLLRTIENTPENNVLIISFNDFNFCTTRDNCKSKIRVNDKVTD